MQQVVRDGGVETRKAAVVRVGRLDGGVGAGGAEALGVGGEEGVGGGGGLEHTRGAWVLVGEVFFFFVYFLFGCFFGEREGGRFWGGMYER